MLYSWNLFLQTSPTSKYLDFSLAIGEDFARKSSQIFFLVILFVFVFDPDIPIPVSEISLADGKKFGQEISREYSRRAPPLSHYLGFRSLAGKAVEGKVLRTFPGQCFSRRVSQRYDFTLAPPLISTDYPSLMRHVSSWNLEKLKKILCIVDNKDNKSEP